MNRDPQEWSVRDVESLPPSHIFTDMAVDMTSEKNINCLDRNAQKRDNRKWYVTI